MATLYYAEHVHIAQIRTRIPITYFCTGRISESESVSCNVNEPEHRRRNSNQANFFIFSSSCFYFILFYFFGVTSVIELLRVSGMHQWTRIRYKQGPPELHGHSAVKVADGMVVYGGESNGVLQGDIWKYHFGKVVKVHYLRTYVNAEF